MLQEQRREGYWRCFSEPEYAEPIASFERLAGLVQLLENLPTTFKDNHRSQVKHGELFAKSVVAKQPRNKNRHFWSRCMSLFNTGEARATHLALRRFKKMGVLAGEPILVLERRRFGMIVDSWVVYQYLEGEPSGLAQVPSIIEILNTIHQHGYQHKDPTFGNFLVAGSGEVFVIDCLLRRGSNLLSRSFSVMPRVAGSFCRCRDFALLATDRDGLAAELVRPSLRALRGDPGYYIYQGYLKFRALRDTIKYTVRGRRPKNR